MTPLKIYRQVSVKDLPKVPNKFYGVVLGIETQIFTTSWFNGDMFTDIQGITFWLEEVELPTEDEIKQQARTVDEEQYDGNYGFHECAKWLLELIKGK